MAQPVRHAATDAPPFHEALKAQRASRSLSVSDVAKRCGVSSSDVEDWERGLTVPAPRAWTRLLGSCFAQLVKYSPFIQAQRLEQEQAVAQAREDEKAPPMPVAVKGTRRERLDASVAQYAQCLDEVAAAEAAEGRALDQVDRARAEGQRLVSDAIAAAEVAKERASEMVENAMRAIDGAKRATQEAREMAELAHAELKEIVASKA